MYPNICHEFQVKMMPLKAQLNTISYHSDADKFDHTNNKQFLSYAQGTQWPAYGFTGLYGDT